MSIKYQLRVIAKGVWRDLITYSRYPAFFLGIALDMISMTIGFLVIGGGYQFNPAVLNVTGLTDLDVFLFMMTGTVLTVFSSIATWGPLNRIENDIHYGTLEAVFVTPTSRIGYLLSTTLSRAIISFIFFIPIYIITLLTAGALGNPRIIGLTLLAIIITVISNISVGLTFGMLAILFRQTRILVSVINMLIQFLCGAYIPVQGFAIIHPVIGKILQYIAMCFPFTYCFDLLRFFLLGGRYVTLLPIWLEFVLIFASTIFYVIIAKLLLIPIERKAKKEGLSIL